MKGERALWSAVLTTAIKDAYLSHGVIRQQARDFLTGGSRWFYQVCDMADVNATWIEREMKNNLKIVIKDWRVR